MKDGDLKPPETPTPLFVQLTDKNGMAEFTSDANGNVSYSVMPDSVPGDIFQVNPPTGQAGFKVP